MIATFELWGGPLDGARVEMLRSSTVYMERVGSGTVRYVRRDDNRFHFDRGAR